MVPRGVKDVGLACRYHQSNIMADSNFRVNMTQFKFAVVVYMCLCVCVCVCMFSSDILDSFSSQRQSAQFFDYYISGLGETLSYNGQRQMD